MYICELKLTIYVVSHVSNRRDVQNMVIFEGRKGTLSEVQIET